MTSEPADITHEKFHMWRDRDGVVHLEWVARSHITIDDARDATSAMSQLTGGQRAALLVNAHNTLAMDRPARMEFVNRSDLVNGVALVVATPLSRLMGNFFIAVNSPVAPTRLFDDEESALEWLRSVAT